MKRPTVPREIEGEDAWTAPRGWFSPFGVLCIVGFLGRLSYEMLRTPITPLYARELGAPTYLIGLIVAAVTITGIVVKMPSGALSDLFGFRRLMSLGAVVKATGPFLYLAVFSWPGLLIVRFYHGLATALYAPPASALVAKVYPDARARRLGTYSAFENAGVVGGPILGGVILAALGFSLAFVVSGAIGLMAFLAMTRIPRDRYTMPEKTHEPGQLRQALRRVGRGVREIAADPTIRLVSLVESLLWMGTGSLQAYLPLYALTLHMPIWQIGLLSGGQGVASVVSRPWLGRRSDTFGRRPLIIAGILLCMAALIVIPYMPGFLDLLPLAVLFGLGTGMVTPSTTAMIGDLVRQGNYGSAMGVFGSIWDMGHAAGPVVFGFLVVALGFRTSWLLMAAGMAGALALFLFGTGRRAGARPAPGT